MWNMLINHVEPPKTGGQYNRVMAYTAKYAKDQGMEMSDLMSASADVKSKLQAKRAFEIRAQNMERAENVLNRELPVLEDAMKALDVSKYPDLAHAELSAMRHAGDPRVTKLDQAAEAVFNEFEQIVTGSPGALNVQDVQKAEDSYRKAQTPQAMQAAIEGMRRIIKNAKLGVTDTRGEIMGDIKRELKGKPKGASSDLGAPPPPSGFQVIE